jgi:hypothetical protein
MNAFSLDRARRAAAVLADDAAAALNERYNLGIQRGTAAVRVLAGG